MTDTSVADLCHLTVRAPSRTIDLAVPSDVPVADLLPTVLRYAGEDIEESGLEHDGWILQRLGGPPLDEEATLASLGLTDGDLLYLRPHTDALPEVRLDDLVDGIASVTRDRLHDWGEGAARNLLRVLIAVAVLAGLALLAWPGTSVALRAGGAIATGALLLAGAASASRALDDGTTGAVLGLLASPALALAGWLVPGGELSGPQGHQVLGARLLGAAAAWAGCAVLALAATAVRTPLFLASALVAFAAAVGGAVMALFDLRAATAAGVVAMLTVLLGGLVPALSFRLAGMRMPALPTNAQQLQEGIDPYRGNDVAVRTGLAGEWMTALYGATGVLASACLVALAHRPALPALLCALVLSLLLVLHGRGLVNTTQRLVLVLPGAWGLLLLAFGWGLELTGLDRALLVVGLLVVAVVLTIAVWTVPGRRLVPYWGRAAELLHSLLAISLLPLTLWLLGVFGALRGWNG
ncbi:type VII secretion integral membrane protein EccD [Streptomyces sp. ITFR-16]|uniref:type VII secretion integral membrane protein EccD n=1 Tax=Streptomyces sp. ITFR-16 TaxID=3075198 RepID=UPI00288B8ECE|nr:type VII secretion integral membrane protein EccD [Streptomyces sp. ITFR-16]WNI21444.1 type VII secretion integral membrane protein EccD [Streptomyces sp. ITFR-16]